MSVIKMRILKASHISWAFDFDRTSDDIIFMERQKHLQFNLSTSDEPGTEPIDLVVGLMKMTPKLVEIIKTIKDVPHRPENRISRKHLTGDCARDLEQNGGIIFDSNYVIFKAALAPKLGFDWEDMVVSYARPLGRSSHVYKQGIKDGNRLFLLEAPYEPAELGDKPKVLRETADMSEAFKEANINVRKDGQIRQLVAKDGITHTFSSETDARAIASLDEIAKRSGYTLPEVVIMLEEWVGQGPIQQ